MSSQAYTPGLKRKENYIVKKTRRLPVPGEVLVKVGDTVSPESIVALASVPGQPVSCNIAYSLSIDASDVTRYMLKKVGDTVESGEPIANYESFFGLVKRAYPSPCNGTVEHISEVSGQVIIREPPLEVRVNAYIPGTVSETLPKQGAVVETPAAYVQGIFGIGGEAYGELKVISRNPDDVLEADQITVESKGKVLVGGALATSDALHKAVKVEAKGVVVGGINESDLRELLGYDIGVAITGHEKIGLTLILTEGFGSMKMLDNTFKMFKKFDGRLACINGATQIRAGVMRPEVVIPRADVPIAKSQESENGGHINPGGMGIGTLVRIIGDPYFGALARIVSLPKALQQMETESSVRVLEAELESDRKRVLIPRANVEIIEE